MSSHNDFSVDRRRMLADQLLDRGVCSARVLTAMETVPRERFVPEESRNYSYADCALPIDCGQTISQPYIVGLMTQSLELTGSERVLEIGTGSGYQTAVLAHLAREVVSIERHALLSQQAQEQLDELGIRNATLLVRDGSLGAPEYAPFERIIVTAAADHTPPALLEQLAEGGLLVIPLGDPSGQMLTQIRKTPTGCEEHALCPCRFVPLIETPPSPAR